MSHTYFQLYYHLVWSTKERLPLIENDFKDDLYAYLGGTIRSKGGHLIQIGGMPDHIHLCVFLPSNVTIADIVRNAKISSTKWVHQTCSKPKLGDFSWQEGYGAFSVSKSNCDTVVEYIQNQSKHHRTRSFREEFIDMLIKHEIEFDEKYLWK